MKEEVSRKASNIMEFVRDDTSALLDLLLGIADEDAYNRIINCPRYPRPKLNKAGGDHLSDLEEILDTYPNRSADLLGSMYQHAFDEEYVKNMGQYFAPQDISDWIFHRFRFQEAEQIIDPGCGTCTFGISLLNFSDNNPQTLNYVGIENDEILSLISAVVLEKISAPTDWRINYINYFNIENIGEELINKKRYNKNIISNPPFVRFHRSGQQELLSKCLKRQTGIQLSGYAGVHAFFLVHSISLLFDDNTNTRKTLTMFLPPEFEKTKDGQMVFSHISKNLDGIKFSLPSGIIEQKNKHKPIFPVKPKIIHLYHPNSSPKINYSDASYLKLKEDNSSGIELQSLTTIRRGISTGANDFFVLTHEDINELNVPEHYRKKIVPTQINLSQVEFSITDWKTHRDAGRPCWLLSIPADTHIKDLSSEIRDYLNQGMADGIHRRTTCETRNKWFSVPLIEPPDIIFKYISRGPNRFIYNRANALILTNLIAVDLDYIDNKNPEKIKKIIRLLNSNLKKWIKSGNIGKTYERNLLKIEPGELAQMPLGSEIRDKLQTKYGSLHKYSES